MEKETRLALPLFPFLQYFGVENYPSLLGRTAMNRLKTVVCLLKIHRCTWSLTLSLAIKFHRTV